MPYCKHKRIKPVRFLIKTRSTVGLVKVASKRKRSIESQLSTNVGRRDRSISQINKTRREYTTTKSFSLCKQISITYCIHTMASATNKPVIKFVGSNKSEDRSKRRLPGRRELYFIESPEGSADSMDREPAKPLHQQLESNISEEETCQ